MITQNKRLLGGVAGAVLLAAIGGFSLARCTADPSAPSLPAENSAESETPADSLAMTADAIREAGIAVETVRAGGLGSEIVAQGQVTASPTAGEALAIVESRDAAQIAADRTAASARAVLAQKALARERYLFDQKVSARVDLERAEAEAAAAEAEARRAQVSVGAANVTRDGRGVIVASPIAGRVTSENVSLGAYVQPEAELFRVADPSKIQVEAAINPGDVARLAAGDRAVVELMDGRTVDGRVRAVTPTLSGETRAATALIEVPGGILQAGLGVRVRLMPSQGAPTNAIVVPEDAVQSVDGRDAVFLRTAQGFRAQFVTLGQRSAGRVEIVSGLKSGATVATRNAFLLKAELGKGAGEEE